MAFQHFPASFISFTAYTSTTLLHGHAIVISTGPTTPDNTSGAAPAPSKFSPNLRLLLKAHNPHLVINNILFHAFTPLPAVYIETPQPSTYQASPAYAFCEIEVMEQTNPN